jgi:hypothetical protein
MKNITLTLLAVLPFFASCSSDSVSSINATPASTAKVAKEVHFNNNSYLLEYNPNHTLRKAQCENGYYNLTYSGGNISKVSGQMNGTAFNVEFTYSADHHITGVIKNGTANTVVYNPAQQYYEIFDNTQNNARYEYLLNNDGDVIEVRRFDNLGHFLNGNTYYYEAGQKGPLYNANRVTLQLAIALPGKALQSCAFGGYRPFKHYAGANAAPIIVDNTFDAEGYVIDSNNEEDDFASFAYTNI